MEMAALIWTARLKGPRFNLRNFLGITQGRDKPQGETKRQLSGSCKVDGKLKNNNIIIMVDHQFIYS